MFVALSSSESNKVIQFNPSLWGPLSAGRILYKLARRINRRVRPRDGTLFSLDWTIFGRLPVGQIPLADLYNLRWTADLLDFRMLRPLAERAPGVIDAVEHGVTGMLAPTGNAKELAACIVRVLSNDVLRESMARAARARAVSHYGLDQQAKAYIALYERLADMRDSGCDV